MNIKNKSLYGGSFARHSSFTVGDRNSFSFRQSVCAEWSTRCIYETLDCLEHGGLVVLSCLTYRLEHRPYIELPSDDSSCFPCFSYSHIRQYVKSIQDYFFKNGISNGYRYFVCSEYGESTGHPHYHVLNFFSKEAVELIAGCVLDLSNCVSYTQVFKDFLQSFWSYGFLRWSRAVSKGGPGIFVNSSYAAKYVAKYVGKDIGFYGKLLSYLGVDRLTPALRKRYKHCLPRHYQSVRFGFNMLDGISEDELLNGKIIEDIKRGKKFRCPVPRYLVRVSTSFLDRDTMSWQLTDFGRHFRILKAFVNAERFARFIDDFRSGDIYIDDSLFDSLGKNFPDKVITFSSLPSSEIAMYSVVKNITFYSFDYFRENFDTSLSFDEGAAVFINKFYSYDYNTVYFTDGLLPSDFPYSFAEYRPVLAAAESTFSRLYELYREDCCRLRYEEQRFHKRVKDNILGPI